MYTRVEIGNILTVQRGIIAHGCNAQGVMGSGIAASIRHMYPKAYDEYIRAHNERGLKLGEIIVVEVAEDLFIANCITQFDYGRDPNTRYVKYSAVKTCFEKLFDFSRRSGLEVHYPLIGAGLANGEWSIINSIINQAHYESADEPNKKTLWILD